MTMAKPACGILVLLLAGAAPAQTPAAPAAAENGAWTATGNIGGRRLYHSPQTPGFTSWVALWKMPDGSLMMSFTQATGPIEGRLRAPKDVEIRLNNPVPGLSVNYDMTGLDLSNVHLRSTDGGATWIKVSADHFTTTTNGAFGEAEMGFEDGTILRGLWGQYLPYNPDVLPTGCAQRSHDGTRTWGRPVPLIDPARYVTLPKRLRRLRDGRIILTGGVADFAPAGDRGRLSLWGPWRPLLLVSADQGRSWTGPIPVLAPKTGGAWTEEWDAAELPNGDLLGSFRRPDPSDPAGHHVRWQGVLKKSGQTWLSGEPVNAPFPHSGHPDLLATREGPILYIAQSGICWTDDAGRTWHRLGVAATGYYPQAVQTDDGLIIVVGHVGMDDAYGAVDQSIVMDSFRLSRPPAPSLP